MKHPVRVAIILLLVAVFIRPGNGCGPFFSEDVFANTVDPDGPYSNYIAGHLGLVEGTYRVRHLVIAYNALSGRGLSPAEQKGAQQAEDYYTSASNDSAAPAAPWERGVPGNDYDKFPNCLVDAQATAEKTLADLRARYGDSADVANWKAGQDAVFSNCEDAGRMPDPAPPNAPLWLKQDRAYQTAAAQFYALDYDGAVASFRAIAADHASPWAPMARYLVARTLIRKATVPYNRFGLNQGTPQQTLEAQAAAVRAGLAQARDQLVAILHDPAMKPLHAASSHLLDYVMIRLDPVTQADVLARRLTEVKPSNSDQAASDYRQNVIDLSYIYSNSLPSYSPWTQYKDAQAQAEKNPPPQFIRWMNDVGKPSPRIAGGAARGAAPDRRGDAIAAWRATHAAQWLVAALDEAQPGEPGNAELIADARQVPVASPAYASATYGRLRLEATTAEPAETVPASTRPVYAEMTELMPKLEKSQPPSAINTFADLEARLSPSLDDYLKNATRIPVGTSLDDDPDDVEAISAPQTEVTLCGASVNDPDARHFDQETATIVNERMPLRMLKDAALLPDLPANTRFELAHMAWTRAMLLDDPEIARALTPYLAGCQPAFVPWLTQYVNAKTADERHVLGLLALMRFTSTEPTVRVGEERDFAAYDDYRDNWWCSADAQGSAPQRPSPATPSLFTAAVVPRITQPDPPFLTAVDRAEADKEIARLQQIPCASDYFAREALAWVKAHPDDAHDADVVGFAMRVVRNACRSNNTADLNHQLFDVLHQKFPKSEWAARYTTWE
jgi:hypothetical protein